jgi:hypothetical protein
MQNKLFYRHINIRVEIEAESDREAEEFFQNMNIVAQTYDKEGYVEDEYDVEIVDWEDLKEDTNV